MKERFELLEKAILTMVEDKKYATLRDILVTMNTADIAGVFNSLEDKRIPLMFRLLPKELAAETFVEMEAGEQESSPCVACNNCFKVYRQRYVRCVLHKDPIPQLEAVFGAK